MENIKKIFLIVVCFTMILVLLQPLVYGTDFDPDDYAPVSTSSAKNVGKLSTIGNTVVGAIRTIGSIASVAVLIVLGIKYMFGSVEAKAEYKKSMLPYVIGAMFVFGITNILAIIISLTGLF